MYIKILLNYLLGYVNIIVEGFFVERFINICMSKNIFLWKIKRDKSAIISANVGIQDFKNMGILFIRLCFRMKKNNQNDAK